MGGQMRALRLKYRVRSGNRDMVNIFFVSGPDRPDDEYIIRQEVPYRNGTRFFTVSKHCSSVVSPDNNIWLNEGELNGGGVRMEKKDLPFLKECLATLNKSLSSNTNMELDEMITEEES
jgi:hypothetical protein